MPYGTYIYDIRRLMAIRRYQNKFRYKTRSIAEHEWSVSRIAMGLALWQTEYSDVKIDMGELLQRTLLHDSIKLFAGDVQSNPRNKALMSDALREVKEVLYDTNFRQMLPQSWQEPFKRFVLKAQDDSVEGKIVNASNIIDKIIESIEEVELGNKRMFEDVLKHQTERLLQIDLDVAKWFVAYCLRDLGLTDIKLHYGEKVDSFIKSYRQQNELNFKEFEGTFGIYIYQVRDLMHTMRYQNLYKHKARSVAQHEWSVSRIAMGLAYWETLKFNNKVSMYELLSTTLLHDTPEYIVGDVLSNVKRITPKMLEAVEKSEKEAFDIEISGILPRQWHEEFRRKMLYPKSDTIEGKIVAAADAIDAVLECVEEIKLGNTEHFKEIAQRVCSKLLEIDLPSVKYFLQYALNDFGLDIRSTYGDEVYAYIQGLKNSD